MLHLDLQHPWRLLLPKACIKVEARGAYPDLQRGLDFARNSSKQMKDPGRLSLATGVMVSLWWGNACSSGSMLFGPCYRHHAFRLRGPLDASRMLSR